MPVRGVIAPTGAESRRPAVVRVRPAGLEVSVALMVVTSGAADESACSPELAGITAVGRCLCSRRKSRAGTPIVGMRLSTIDSTPSEGCMSDRPADLPPVAG